MGGALSGRVSSLANRSARRKPRRPRRPRACRRGSRPRPRSAGRSRAPGDKVKCGRGRTMSSHRRSASFPQRARRASARKAKSVAVRPVTTAEGRRTTASCSVPTLVLRYDVQRLRSGGSRSGRMLDRGHGKSNFRGRLLLGCRAPLQRDPGRDRGRLGLRGRPSSTTRRTSRSARAGRATPRPSRSRTTRPR